MKILVTGSEGQLARSLLERGALDPEVELVAVGRPRLDLAVPGSAAEVVAALRPDVVINAAAYTAVDEAEERPGSAFRLNAEAAGEVAAAAARIGASVVQISTDYVFDGRSERPYHEGDRPNPLGVYGRSKLAGEERVRDANPRHAIVRTAWVYSPFARNFVKTMIEAAQVRDVLTVVDDQRGNPSSALDLADALLRMAAWTQASGVGVGEIYHLAGTGETSWFGLAEFLMGECGNHGLRAAEVRPIKTAEWPTRAARPAFSGLDSSKFARDFGFTMPSWQESAARVTARLREALARG
jgi:dTDP-4-dehydrorhamnose reductase